MNKELNFQSQSSSGMLSLYISNESEFTAAILIGLLNVEKRSEVLSKLPARFAESLIKRMEQMGPIPKAHFDLLIKTVEKDFKDLLGEDIIIENCSDECRNILKREDKQKGQS